MSVQPGIRWRFVRHRDRRRKQNTYECQRKAQPRRSGSAGYGRTRHDKLQREAQADGHNQKTKYTAGVAQAVIAENKTAATNEAP
jgi:hypothetical protein